MCIYIVMLIGEEYSGEVGPKGQADRPVYFLILIFRLYLFGGCANTY